MNKNVASGEDVLVYLPGTGAVPAMCHPQYANETWAIFEREQRLNALKHNNHVQRRAATRSIGGAVLSGAVAAVLYVRTGMPNIGTGINGLSFLGNLGAFAYSLNRLSGNKQEARMIESCVNRQ